MARKNRNTFLKRQKEMERMRKAREKTARRQGKPLMDPRSSVAAPVWGAGLEAALKAAEASTQSESDATATAEGGSPPPASDQNAAAEDANSQSAPTVASEDLPQ